MILAMVKKFLATAWLAAVALSAQAQYRIIGDVTGIDDGTLLYLTLVGKEHVNIDSTTIRNGHFEFSGGRVDKPKWALVKIKGSFVATCDFYLENGDIAIQGERYRAKASVTPINRQYDEYNSDINSMGNTIYSLNVNISMEQDAARRDSLKAELKKTEQLQRTKELNFIRRYPDSPISLRIAGYLVPRMSATEALAAISLLSEQQQQDEEIIQAKRRAEQLAKVEAGAVAPDFTLPTDKGAQLSLSAYKGKYVMIDFWASWCGPCRASFPAIAAFHKKYGSQLAIVGVSLDRGEPAWRKALSEEKCTWAQAWDQQGMAARSYAVSAIPLLVLIGPDGKIIGRYSKADITDELQRLFGE